MTQAAAADIAPAGNTPSRLTRGGALLIVALYAAGVLLPFLGSSRTMTSHEVMVTHPAQRILIENTWSAWIVPPYAEGLWLDKPPLLNWVTAGVFMLFGGFSEFAARLPAAVSAIALCLLMAWLAGRYYGPRVALLTGLVQATCMYTYMQGRLGEIDMPFTLLLAAAHAVLVCAWFKPERAGRPLHPEPHERAGRPPHPESHERAEAPLHPPESDQAPVSGWSGRPARSTSARWRISHGRLLLFHTIAALAVLAKGPLAVVFLGATVLCFCAFQRTWQPLIRVIATPAVLVFILIAGGWHLLAYSVAGQEALDQWAYNSILRAFGLHHLGLSKPLLYLYMAPMLLLPWSVALLIGARWLWHDARRPGAALEQYLWAWFFGGFIFLTILLFGAKHYILPALPPLSIFAARLIEMHLFLKGIHARRFYWATFIVLLILYGVVSGAIMPTRDHRAVTAEFTRTATAQVPDDEPLYVIALGQSSAYPYIQHDNCVYLPVTAGEVGGALQPQIDLKAIHAALTARDGEPMWILSLRGYIKTGAEAGFSFELIAAEPARPKHPVPETHVLGLLGWQTPPTTFSTEP